MLTVSYLQQGAGPERSPVPQACGSCLLIFFFLAGVVKPKNSVIGTVPMHIIYFMVDPLWILQVLGIY